MPFLDRDGIEIYYEVHGASGPPVLLSHGFSATSQMWRPQLEALSSDYRVIVWDMRGHGRSGSPPDPERYSLEATLEDLAGLLDACGAPRAVIGGHSLGGYVSLAFAARYPDRVRALLLLNTGPGFKRDEPRDAWNRQARAQADAFESRGLDALPPEHTAWAGAHRSAQGLALAARGMLAQRDGSVFAGLGQHHVPALVLVGSEDHAFLRAAEIMEAILPKATRVVVEGAGHAANVDCPREVNEALLHFLASVQYD